MYLVACTSWKVQEVSPQHLLAEQDPEQVRVTKTDGMRITIWEPRVVADTLRGLTEPDAAGETGESTSQKVAVSVPLEEIEYMAVRKVNWENTLAVAVAAGVVVSLIVVLATGEDIVTW
jgi:hypothetical protein